MKSAYQAWYMQHIKYFGEDDGEGLRYTLNEYIIRFKKEVIYMRYVIYTVDRNEEVFGNADVHDCYIVDSALERNQYLMEEVMRDTCIEVLYAPIYKCGEYGKRIVVKLYDVVDFTGIEKDVLVKLGGII